MSLRTLSQRELNRTTLTRQLLLERDPLSATDAVERLVGLQAQVARPPYIGLWTRLSQFTHEDLAHELHARTIVKATFIRGTLHLLTSADYVKFRATLQPVLTEALETIVKQRGATVDIARLLEAARTFMDSEPRSFAELTTLLTALVPDGDAGAMRYAVRTHLPMIQVPIRGGWSYPGNPRFALADRWLTTPLDDCDRRTELVRRYLRAFGPAGVKDMETWSYLSNLTPVFAELRGELVEYRDERGRQLFDLPDLPIGSVDGPAPVRFLPEFDNLLLAHQDRTRVMPDDYRKRVYLPGLRVAASVLLDGMVAATWTTERVKRDATLLVSPFRTLSRAERAALTQEGEQLLRFVEPDARAFAVHFAE